MIELKRRLPTFEAVKDVYPMGHCLGREKTEKPVYMLAEKCR